MGFASAKDIADLMAQPPPEPEQLPFLQGVAANFEFERFTNGSLSLSYQMKDGIEKSLTRLRESGIDVPETPRRPWSNGEVDLYGGILDTHKDAIAGLKGDPNSQLDPLFKTFSQVQQDAAERVSAAQAEAARGGFGTGLLGGLGAAALDPLNVMTLPLGLGRATTVAGRLAVEAAIGSSTNVLAVAASTPARENVGIPTTGADYAAAAGVGAVLGGGVAGIIEAPSFIAGRIAKRAERTANIEQYHAAVRDGSITPTREMSVAADTIQDHLDTVPVLHSPEAEVAHLEAVDAAVRVLQTEDATLAPGALKRLDEKVAAATGREAELTRLVAESEAADAAQGIGRPANFGLNVARPGIANALGIDPSGITSTRLPDGGLRLELPQPLPGTNGVEIRGIEIAGDMDIPAARRALDEFTTAAGLDPVPLSRRETLTAELDATRTARETSTRQAEGARVEASRRIEDSIGQPGGVPFKTRKAAEQYAARTHVGPHSVEPSGRGFVVTPEHPMDAPGSIAAEIDARVLARDAIDAVVATERAAPVAPVVEPPIDAPVAPVPDADPVARASFDAATEADPELRASYRGADGTLIEGRAADVIAKLDDERTTLREIFDCMIGGGDE